MKIRNLVLALAVLSGQIFGATAQITGVLHGPTGNLFNGSLKIYLPFAGAVDINCGPPDPSGDCGIIPQVYTFPVTLGSLPSTAQLHINGDIQPHGTYYKVYEYDLNGKWLAQFNIVIPAGATTFDLGAALQTSVTTNNVSYINPANLTGNNTWTGNNTFNGAVTFTSTVTGISFPCPSPASANSVCGNNTGISTSPSYVSVNYAMTDGSTIAPINSPTFTGTPAAPTPPLGDSSTRIATTAWFTSQVGSGLILASIEVSTCNLAPVGGEWGCTGTITWGTTLPITNYKVVCTHSEPQPDVSYAQPAGFDTVIHFTTKTSTTTGYILNDDHSGSNGAGYKMDCIATR
jgi:hypothetical protein